MHIDKISSKERMNNLFKGKPIDRIPVLSYMEAFAGKVCNYGTKEYYLNPQIAYDCQVITKELFGYDDGPGYDIPSGYIEQFGGEIEYLDNPKLSFPKIKRYAVNSLDEIESLTLPDITTGFLSKRILEFNKILYEKDKNIGVTAGSPLNIAIAIVGPNNLLKWMIKEPNMVHKLLRFATDYILENARVHKEIFKDASIGAGIAAPIESHNVISPKNFEKFSLPYIVEIYNKFTEMNINIQSVHLCGDHKKNISIWKDSVKLKPRTLITLGEEADMVELSKQFGEDFIIGGNLRNKTLQLGKPSDVYNEAKEMILKMKNFKGGYAIAPDCTLSYLTPSANLYAMIKAARDFGSY